MPSIRRAIVVAAAVFALIAVPVPASAATGTVQQLPQCSATALATDDDALSALVALGFTINFGGTNYSFVRVDANGKVWFSTLPASPASQANRAPDISALAFPAFVPFGSDVAERDAASSITYGASGGVFCVIWNNVQGFASDPSLRNTFQLLITDASDMAGRRANDFNITFNYDSMTWSNNGAAMVGYTDGSTIGGRYLEFEGGGTIAAPSGEPNLYLTGGFLDLAQLKSGSAVPGRQIYSVINPPDADHLASIVSFTPIITGTGTLGSTLTANAGTWGPSPVEMAHQWKRDGVAIAGATASTYAVTEADLGHSITVSATGAKTLYETASRESGAFAVALAAASVTTPQLSGQPVVGATVSVSAAATPATSTLGYQWLRNGTPIAGATTATYVTSAADAGTSLSAVVTASRSGYATATGTSASLPITGTFTASTPKISGTAKVGKTLKATIGSWSPTPAFAYQWYANGKAIKKASKATLKLVASVKGKKIMVKVTGSKPGYTTVVKTSTSTKAVKK